MDWWSLILIAVILLSLSLLIKTIAVSVKKDKILDHQSIEVDSLRKKYNLFPRCFIYNYSVKRCSSLFGVWILDKKNSFQRTNIFSEDPITGKETEVWKRQLYKLLKALPIYATSDLCVIYTKKRYVKLMNDLKPTESEIDEEIVKLLIGLERNGTHICFEEQNFKLEGCREAKKVLGE